MKTSAALRLVFLVGTSAALARGDTVEACLSASEQGQQARKEGHWKQARERFESCARDVCPAEVRQDCHGWLNEVNARMPSLVFRARDRQGRDLSDVRVWIDDKLVREQLDGKAVQLEPGPHRLRLERGAARAELEVVVTEVEKARLVEVTLETPPPVTSTSAAPHPPPTKPIPTATFLLGGVALVGAVGFAYLGSQAQSEVDQMRSSCAPACPSSRVDQARREALLANVSLGAGVLALGAAVAIWWAAPAAPSSASVWVSPGFMGGGWRRTF